MKFELPPLPYAKNALEPHLSATTLETHYEKHHRGYLTKLQGMLEGKPEANKSLEEIIKSSSGGVFNNAAQIWNHTFYWNSMRPNGGGKPGAKVTALLSSSFGSVDEFAKKWDEVAMGHFGSGYVWLSFDPKAGKLVVESTSNADNPMVRGLIPVLTMDIWEHAYYIDYKNGKKAYFDAFAGKLLNWDFVEQNLSTAKAM